MTCDTNEKGRYKVQCSIVTGWVERGNLESRAFVLLIQPVDMIGHQRSIEKDAEPLPCNEEEEVEENMEDVFREHQRVQTGALVNRILVVSFQLIKSNDLQRK